MNKKAKYYKAMNFEYAVVLNMKEKPSPHDFWCRLDAITNVAMYDTDISSVKEYMKIAHHKERLAQKYIGLLVNLPR